VTDIAFDHHEPRLPRRTAASTAIQLAVSATIHGAALAAIVIAVAMSQPMRPPVEAPSHTVAPEAVALPRIVFSLPRVAGGGGGGGGGNRSTEPIRRAEGVGHDRATLPARPTVAPPATIGAIAFTQEERMPAVLLEARPLASGDAIHAGLPAGGVPYGDSQGPGSGGGVGTGTGTGIGPGVGPGVGPGSGGGIGGGVYRPGGSVTAPRLLVEVKPKYSSDALRRKIQGSVWLQLVVARTGIPTDIRVVRSLDPSLDLEAVAAMQFWRFAPGTLAGSPVDVEVVVQMDFSIR
jgi:periplasmic protein TonB